MTHKVICESWTERERGWGFRPDGYSYHKSPEDLREFTEEYWEKMPDEVPDEYSHPDGSPHWADVSLEVYQEVAASKNGIRSWRRLHDV